MTEKIELAIEGRKFYLTREEASFVEQNLRTALTQPNLALDFSQRRSSGMGLISLTRHVACASGAKTDC